MFAIIGSRRFRNPTRTRRTVKRNLTTLVTFSYAHAYDGVECRILTCRLQRVLGAGVPFWEKILSLCARGSFLSPLLMNILLSSAPVRHDVHNLSRINDVAFFSSPLNINTS